ncbi:MAG: sensor domain-containing protein [Dehalococcoidia bacterium]|nr:sensor domain-containing protein [Dehalococcoidia bacterium]
MTSEGPTAIDHETHGQLPAGRSGRRAPAPLRWYLSVFRDPQTWKNALYLLLSFPMGLAYFVALVTLISAGGGLAITLVGLPVLVAVMFGWCMVAEVERWLANRLLRTQVGPLGFDRESGVPWVWPRVRTRLENPMTWRSLLFLFLRFPQGVAAFVLLNLVVVFPAFMIAVPVIAAATGGNVHVVWEVNTWYEGLPFTPAGILLLPLGLRLVNAAAYLSGKLSQACLGWANSVDSRDRISQQLDTVAAWRGLSLDPDMPAAARRLQTAQLRVLGGHLAVVLLVDLFFVTLNGPTTPDVWWSLWVVWASTFALSLHAGYVVYGWLGAHAGFYLAINLGFFVIDAVYSSNVWFYWIAAPWLPFLLLHATLDGRWRRSHPASPASQPAIAPAGQLTTAVDTTAPAGAPSPAPAPLAAPSEPTGEPAPSVSYHAGDPGTPRGITVDIVMRRVTVDGAEVDLTPKEFELLALLIQNPGRPFSRDELLDRIWRNDYEITDRTVDTHVQRLRKKLGAQAEAIQTVWGVGSRYSG